MSYASTVLSDTPVRYWQLNEPSGVTAVDYSGNSADATYLNNPSLGVTPSPIQGETAVTFTRASDHLIFRDTSTTMLDGNGIDIFSLELWVKRSATQGLDMGLHSWNNTTGTYLLHLFTDNKIRLTIVGSGETVISAAALTDTASWHHIVATHDATTSTMYLDGADVSASQQDFAQFATSGRACVGAQSNTANVYDGSLAQAAIYNTVLTASQVAAHYAAATPAAETMLVMGMIGTLGRV